MIIKRKSCNLKKLLDTMRPGDTFELGFSVYMKTAGTGSHNGMAVACINLSNGEVVRLRYDTEIIPFKAELVEV